MEEGFTGEIAGGMSFEFQGGSDAACSLQLRCHSHPFSGSLFAVLMSISRKITSGSVKAGRAVLPRQYRSRKTQAVESSGRSVQVPGDGMRAPARERTMERRHKQNVVPDAVDFRDRVFLPSCAEAPPT